MSGVSCRGLSRVIALGGLLLLVLTSCTPEGGDSTPDTSRLTLRLTTADAARSLSLRRADTSGQTRQSSIARIQVEVTGEGIPTPIVATCTVPNPSEPECRVVSQTEATLTLGITLSIPMGTNRRIRVVTLDASGTGISLGTGSVNLTTAEQQVEIPLNPIATASDLENRIFTLADGAVFGLSGQSVRLEFGDFGGTNTGPVTLGVPELNQTVTGTATVGTLEIQLDQSLTPGGPTDFPLDATVNDGILTLIDQNGVSSTSTNSAPTAADDAATILENTEVSLDLVANDSDPQGDPLTLVSLTQPTRGTAVDNGDGTVTYVPIADFNGTDTFAYTIRDPGGLEDTATVTVKVVYDDFESDTIREMKWQNLELVRQIQNGKLVSRFRRFGLHDPFETGNRLVFVDPTSINTIEAEVTVTEVSNSGAFPAALIAGSFYNDGTSNIGATGDIIGFIGIGHNGSELAVFFGIGRCDDEFCDAVIFLDFDVTTFGPVAPGTPHMLSLGWDGANFTFGFDGSPVLRDPTALAPMINPTPHHPFKNLQTRVLGPPNGIGPAIFPGPEQGGSIAATFDDVLVNGVPFDNFESSQLDASKWQTLEFVRQVQDGKLVSSVRQSGPPIREEEGESDLEFVAPGSVTAFEAEVTVTQVTSSGASPTAFLAGAFYNNGSNVGGEAGDVIGFIGIGHDGTELLANFGVAQCEDQDCFSLTVLDFDTTTFGPVPLGEPRRLSLAWDGTSFTFGFDGTTASFTPSPDSVVGFPRSHFTGLGTRIGGAINGGNTTTTLSAIAALTRQNGSSGPFAPLDPNAAGSITATFDHVLVSQRTPTTTTVIGSVVDPTNSPAPGVTVTTNGGVTGVTGADGSFSIPNVPADMGDIAASAALTDPITGITLTGSSTTVLPRFGETDVGTIALLSEQRDTVILQSEPFLIPPGMNLLRFEANFLSNEFPDFVGDVFDDTAFTLLRTNGSIIATQVLGSVNVSAFFPANGSGFNGQTGFRTVDLDVSSLAGSSTPAILVIGIRDAGDDIIDSAVLIDHLRLVDTNTTQTIPNGGFESGDFSGNLRDFTVIFQNQNDPMAAVITGLGPIGPPEGNFMAFLSTGMEASSVITVPPGIVVTPPLQ